VERERHTGEPALWRDSGSHGVEVNKVTYKTPDYMLCSAQDCIPARRATSSTSGRRRLGRTRSSLSPIHVRERRWFASPNFWHGNDTLPCVAQWKDVLIAVHSLPEDDWMGFTHAFFPAFAFDEYDLVDGWAFARKATATSR